MKKKRWADWVGAGTGFVVLAAYFPDQLSNVLAAMVATITTTLLMGNRG